MLSCLGILVSVAFIAVTLAFLAVAGRAATIAARGTVVWFTRKDLITTEIN